MKRLLPLLLIAISTSLHAQRDTMFEELQRKYPAPEFGRGPRVIAMTAVDEAIYRMRLAGSPVPALQAPGWRVLGHDDFTAVNSAEDTWTWYGNVLLHCTGNPVSVLRTRKPLTNFELYLEWCHLKPAGNSGVFIWTTPESVARLATAGKPGLPDGIEVQVLDNAYTDTVAEAGGRTDWFTTHGDVFPVRVKMTPIGKVSPNGTRSFPRANRSRNHGHWNQYYIRAINGEVRLWVNGEEVSGGTACDPATGYLCLESEGSPILFRHLRIREVP